MGQCPLCTFRLWRGELQWEFLHIAFVTLQPLPSGSSPVMHMSSASFRKVCFGPAWPGLI